MSKVIEAFIHDYVKRKEEYIRVKEYAQNKIELALKDAGIMAIVTARIKDAERLNEKLVKRNEKMQYTSMREIAEDIVDLIGVRIALYFPNDREKVKAIVRKHFDIIKVKEFPDGQQEKTEYKHVFQGYRATHYRVYPKADKDSSFEGFRIEIQVASLLMHAWAEVEHDLTYKQKKGKVSYDEYEALDEINGLVLAGELSLQRLQRASEFRIASEREKFSNHYQLASYLFDRAKEELGNVSIDLGDVETLYKLCEAKDRLTIRKIENDLAKVEWESEVPIAYQLVDILSDNSIKYSRLVTKNIANKKILFGQATIDDALIGAFLRNWVELEKKIEQLSLQFGYAKGDLRKTYGALQNIIPLDVLDRYTALRKARNALVHGMNDVDEKHIITCIDEIAQVSDIISKMVREQEVQD